MDENTIYCNSATTTATTIVLTPNREVKNLSNTGCYGLVICCNAVATSNLPVFIDTAVGQIPVLCKFGNTIYANQLKKRVRYSIGYGNGNSNYTAGQFVVFNKVCPRSEITTTGTDTSENGTGNDITTVGDGNKATKK